MNELDCILGPCLNEFSKSPLNVSISIFFLILIFGPILFLSKEKSMKYRILWIYLIIFSFLFSLSYFTFSMICNDKILYSIPISLFGVLIFAYLILPQIFFYKSKTIHSELGKSLPNYVPVYIADSGKPFAYSYNGIQKWIVVSVGMIEILDELELNAVLLHEYAHIVNRSSFYKSSEWIFSKLPILNSFLDEYLMETEEELEADKLAIKIQKTSKYIELVKKKLSNYFME